ncbi:prepro-urotensin II-beta isoform X1 [Pseudorasbora parva]|uniref:prepro-urotensin II-beta isoform X1 n=1 Tax=Pseudorasbora parva TaxID=51549 RepID=UPI00351EEDC1
MNKLLTKKYINKININVCLNGNVLQCSLSYVQQPVLVVWAYKIPKVAFSQELINVPQDSSVCYLSGVSSAVLVEEEQALSPEDLSYSEQAYLSQSAAGFGYPSLVTGDISSDGLRTAGFVPSQAVKEVLLEKPLLNPLSRFLGGRKQYRKRGSNTECFWKYCV